MTLLPRLVAFDITGKAIAAGCAAHIANGAKTEVCHLPSEHPDFIDCDVQGMTLEELHARAACVYAAFAGGIAAG